MQDMIAFSEEFNQQTRLRAEDTKNFSRSAMAELATEWMINEGEIEEFIPAYHDVRGMRVDGYGFSEKDDAIDLFVVDYTQNTNPTSLTATEIQQEFNRLKNFFIKGATKQLHKTLEESSPAYGLAWSLMNRAASFGRIRLFLLSNRLLSSRVDVLEGELIGSWLVSFHVWDLQRLARLQDTRPEPIVIDFEQDFSQPLPCLPAHLPSDDYRSYLLVVPGQTLAELYEKYGSRLLELNVRTFLQLRGKVNKGIRNTIQNEPNMFFAYNNGITATAEDVSTRPIQGAEHLVTATNFQIVNGGQTTASLYHAKRRKTDLNGTFVQVKLSVVKPELSTRVAPNIAQYANTQNRVSDSDFFSNHAFHVRIEEISRRIWAPAVDGSQRQTKWFYERARGQYAEAQSSMTKAEINRWKKEYPKPQMFTKTDIAKFENVWDGNPVVVNRGAQKNFVEYAKRIGKRWEEDNTLFNDRYFKRAVARAIVFRTTEKLVSAQPWYQGGYRANIVAYTQALLGERFGREKLVPDWDGIWLKQATSPAFQQALIDCAMKINDFIVDTPEQIRNVTEWCKKEACWEGIQKIHLDLPEELRDELVGLSEETAKEKDAKELRVVDNGIEAQKEVLKLGAPFWRRLHDFSRNNKVGISPKEQGVLGVAMSMPVRLPSDKQSTILMALLKRMEIEGFQIEPTP